MVFLNPPDFADNEVFAFSLRRLLRMNRMFTPVLGDADLHIDFHAGFQSLYRGNHGQETAQSVEWWSDNNQLCPSSFLHEPCDSEGFGERLQKRLGERNEHDFMLGYAQLLQAVLKEAFAPVATNG